MGVAGAGAGTFGIQPLVGAFGVPYQSAEPRDERLIRVPLRICTQMSQGVRARVGAVTSLSASASASPHSISAAAQHTQYH